MRKLLACLLLFFVVFGSVSSWANAQNAVVFPEVSGGQINEAIAKTTNVRLLPTNPFYFVVTIKETVSRIFQPSSARRAEFDFVLTSKRLKEAYLLAEANDYKNMDTALSRYTGRIGKMQSLIEKARLQNQNIEPVIGDIANGFNYQEVLFYAISKKVADGGYSDETVSSASVSFMNAIDAIDAFRPGFKNRYRSAMQYTIAKQKLLQPSSAPTETDHFESTPSANPRRIIY